MAEHGILTRSVEEVVTEESKSYVDDLLTEGRLPASDDEEEEFDSSIRMSGSHGIGFWTEDSYQGIFASVIARLSAAERGAGAYVPGYCRPIAENACERTPRICWRNQLPAWRHSKVCSSPRYETHSSRQFYRSLAGMRLTNAKLGNGRDVVLSSAMRTLNSRSVRVAGFRSGMGQGGSCQNEKLRRS